MEKKKKKKESTLDTIKKTVSSYSFLYVLFILLLIIVIMLGLMVFSKGKETKNNKANLVIPILADGTHNGMKIDLSSLQGNEYVIKITNYRGRMINKEEINYTITIKNNTTSKIIVTKDDEKANLMVDQESTKIEGVSLNSKKKAEAIYRIKLQDNQQPKKGDMIEIEVAS